MLVATGPAILVLLALLLLRTAALHPATPPNRITRAHKSVDEMLRRAPPPPLVVLGVDISAYSAPVQLAVCASGVFFCFLLYGVAQESIMLRWKQHDASLGWFLTMTQCGFYSLVTWVGSHSQQSRKPPPPTPTTTTMTTHSAAPLRSFLLIGTLSMLTIGLSNTAIEHVSYATQVAFKSSKPIPVMLGGVLILNKSYAFVEVVATCLLVVGLVLFTSADHEVSLRGMVKLQPSVGVLLLLCALVIDGVIGNIQQRTFARFTNVSPAEMIFKTKGFAALLSLGACLVQGQLPVAYRFSVDHPDSLIPIAIYCTCGVVGEVFVMAIIKRFGALAAVITTSVRKAFTMMISFFLFSKPWTQTYLFAALLLWTGVGLHVWAENAAPAHHHSNASGSSKKEENPSADEGPTRRSDHTSNNTILHDPLENSSMATAATTTAMGSQHHHHRHARDSQAPYSV